MAFIVLFAVFVGANTVVCRYLNTRCAVHNGQSMATLLNYITGLSVSMIVLLAVGDSGAVRPLGALTLRTGMMFLGGAFGMVMVQMFIYVTPRLPAFLGTVLIFASQLGFGLLLDLFLTGSFSLGKLLGVLLVLLGLLHYVWVNRRQGEAERCAVRAP